LSCRRVGGTTYDQPTAEDPRISCGSYAESTGFSSGPRAVLPILERIIRLHNTNTEPPSSPTTETRVQQPGIESSGSTSPQLSIALVFQDERTRQQPLAVAFCKIDFCSAKALYSDESVQFLHEKENSLRLHSCICSNLAN
jgi:hypothetical protein